MNAKMSEMGGREAMFGVPTNPETLRKVFTTKQLRDIAGHIGAEELARLSQDPNHNPEHEGRNLDTVRRAVSAVIGEDAGAPRILNFASDFAKGLQDALDTTANSDPNLSREIIGPERQ
jgi:hypothetical protein